MHIRIFPVEISFDELINLRVLLCKLGLSASSWPMFLLTFYLLQQKEDAWKSLGRGISFQFMSKRKHPYFLQKVDINFLFYGRHISSYEYRTWLAFGAQISSSNSCRMTWPPSSTKRGPNLDLPLNPLWDWISWQNPVGSRFSWPRSFFFVYDRYHDINSAISETLCTFGYWIASGQVLFWSC